MEASDKPEAHIEARMDYRRVASGTLDEMREFYSEHCAERRHDERIVLADGTIVPITDPQKPTKPEAQ